MCIKNYISFQPGLMSPAPDTYVKSAVLILGYSGKTCGYWPHSIFSWLIPSLESRLHIPLFTHIGKDQYKYALNEKAKRQ